MLYNHAPAIILNLLFYDITNRLQKATGADGIAISPLMDCPQPSMPIQADIHLKTLTKTIDIQIGTDNFSNDEIDAVLQAFSEMIKETPIALSLVCKRNFLIHYDQDIQKTINASQLKEIVLTIFKSDIEKSIHVVLPFQFFRLFSNSIPLSSSPSDIENYILGFFKNPKWMLPDLSYLFGALPGSELSQLFNYLQKNNLLTPYQVFLLIQAYPELSGKIKNTLSQNSINDVIRFNKDKHLKITKRDIAGGVYSIEESLLLITRGDIDVSYSRLLKHMQQIVRLSIRTDLVLKKQFISWLEEIQSQGLLHATVSATGESVVAAAISRDSNSYLSLLRKHLTERKIGSIAELTRPLISYDEIMIARSILISNFRKLRMKRIPVHPDRLEYLLSAFSNPDEYQYLLFSVGWFILSTALKGVNRKTISRIVDHIPYRAGILIEDVISGIVNPNILHDEMQINKARIRCVGSILELYYEGLINLE